MPALPYAGSICDPEYIAISCTVQGTGRHRDFVDMEIIKTKILSQKTNVYKIYKVGNVGSLV